MSLLSNSEPFEARRGWRKIKKGEMNGVIRNILWIQEPVLQVFINTIIFIMQWVWVGRRVIRERK